MTYKTLLYIGSLLLLTLGFQQKQTLPDGFVYAKSVIPDLDVELRYFSTQ